jgi:hypothetical protein
LLAGINLGVAGMSAAIVLAAVAIAGFVCAMIQNWMIVSRVDEERREMFRRGYHSGFLDARYGRKCDWPSAWREEEDRGHGAQ